MGNAAEPAGLLAGRSVLLGITGSIAAYKAADIASRLRSLGADVHAAMTENATRFVGPATLRALTGNAVLSGVFDEPYDHAIAHIHAAQSVDLVLVAPATANVIGCMAHGIAGDMLTTLLLAAHAPVLVAPAMNTAMLEHPATVENLAILERRGVRIIAPAVGMLACRTEGAGKLADVADIVAAVVDALCPPQTLAGRSVLVTAGPTREALDPVRFLTNRSSGKMGVAICQEAMRRGASVTLVAGPMPAAAPPGCRVIRIESAAEMLAASLAHFGECDALIAAAAPADYAPAARAASKIKKDGSGGLTVELRETPDIVGTLAAGKVRQVVVGFAAETEDLVANARQKLVRKRLDLVVANDVTAPGAGFDVDTNIATLVWADGQSEALPMLSKRDLGGRIVDEVARLLAARTPE